MYGLQKGSQLMEAFVKTVDKNIVNRYRVVKEELYLSKLREQIDAFQQQIDDAHVLIPDYPPGVSDEVKRAIDEWNAGVFDTTDLEEIKAMYEKVLADAGEAEPTPVGGIA